MTVPTKILDLVTRFDTNLEAYRSGKYNEAQVCQEFLNPLTIDTAGRRMRIKGVQEITARLIV